MRGMELDRVGSARFASAPAGFEPVLLGSIATPEIMQTPGLLAADTLIERADIVAQANDLLANRGQIVEAYKTNQTYEDDARTLLFEALTASGHLSVVRMSGSLPEIHAAMLAVLLNAYSDRLPAHEQRRRFQEICEELSLQALEMKIANGEVSDDTEFATISDYVDEKAIGKKSAQSIGYRPYNKKGMVRSSRLLKNEDGTYTRVTKQVSRSNADAVRTKHFLATEGVMVREAAHADVAVLGTQLLHSAEEGVVGLMKRLDAHQGATIRYGEALSTDQLGYDELEAASVKREEVMKCYVTKLAAFTKNLDQKKRAGAINQKDYDSLFKNEVGNILRAICVMDPDYAVSCFGEKAEAGFIKASNLVAEGNFAAAEQVLLGNMKLEQTVSFCGGSISKEEAEARGIKTDSITDLLKTGKEEIGEKNGICRVENCPTDQKSTKVGGCNVCLGKCQPLFNKGWKYETIVAFWTRMKQAKERVVKTTKKIVRKVVSVTSDNKEKLGQKANRIRDAYSRKRERNKKNEEYETIEA